MKNDSILRAIRHEPIDRTPIWIMRQAGRYLPEYRALRATAGSFMTLCKTPELACEVTIQPLRRFALDAAILFSDILTIPDAMGLGLSFKEGEGPHFAKTLNTAHDIQTLRIPDPETELTYVLDAIKLIRTELNNSVPLIGFCGSPWTLACYMVEGRANKAFPRIHKLKQEQPALLHQLLDTLAQAISAHLIAQIKAGVQVAMVFDTWGGMLGTADYNEFSLHYCRQIFHALEADPATQHIPRTLFTKGGGQWLELMSHAGCQTLGVDWLVDLKRARAEVGQKVCLQGNMNPDILKGTPAEIRAEVARLLAAFGHGSGHIFNLGHGITPDVPPENVAVLVDAVHELSEPFHRSC